MSARRADDDGRDSQIALIELATDTLIMLTSGSGHRSSPSYSHEGRKLIYRRANHERESGKTRFSDWDIYELEMDKRLEKRLTSFRFYSVTPPYYLPGDQSFIFSGEGPKEYVSANSSKGFQAYKTEYQDNTIFVRTLVDNRPLSPLFLNGTLSTYPLITETGDRVFYTARTDHIDGSRPRMGYTYDIFAFDHKEHVRLTKQDDLIINSVLSSDGMKVGLVILSRNEKNIRNMKLLDVKSGRMETLESSALLSK